MPQLPDPTPPDTELAWLEVWFVRADPEDPHSEPLRPAGVSLWMRDGVTATELRRFGWARWLPVADAVARTGGETTHPLWRSEDMFDPKTVQGKASRAYYEEWDLPYRKKRPGRKGHEPEFYEQVAKRYLALRADGVRNPTQTIAEEKHYSRDTVAGWVRRARELGYLPPGRRGRAG
jgi:hypothetical protein